MRNRYAVLASAVLLGLAPRGPGQGPPAADPKALARGRAFAEAGRVDLFVASSAAWGLPADDDRNWEPAVKLGLELARDSGLKQWPPIDMPKAFLSMAEYRAHRFEPKPVFVRQGTPYDLPDKLPDGKTAYHGNRVVLAPGVSAPNIYGSILLSRGDITARRSSIGWSVVFTTGDVTAAGNLTHTILVSDGDVVVAGHILRALVIARGRIHAKGSTFESVLVAGGKVTIDKPSRADPEDRTRIFEDEKFQLGFVKFFELSRVGVAVEAAGRAVRVTAAADGKTFAAAGGKAGDVIEGVNGATPDSPEALRRLLRDALAVGDAAVAVRRGDATHTLKVTLPE